jgi:hypothetical protein
MQQPSPSLDGHNDAGPKPPTSAAGLEESLERDWGRRGSGLRCWLAVMTFGIWRATALLGELPFHRRLHLAGEWLARHGRPETEAEMSPAEKKDRPAFLSHWLPRKAGAESSWGYLCSLTDSCANSAAICRRTVLLNRPGRLKRAVLHELGCAICAVLSSSWESGRDPRRNGRLWVRQDDRGQELPGWTTSPVRRFRRRRG